MAHALLLDRAVPLLTLTGPGGSGKTRLALAIARDVAERFADGVIWVDLGPLADLALVPDSVARAIGFTPSPGLPVEEQLVRELLPRQTLLLLDNCEHLAPAVGDLAASLLVACPDMQVLATSRAPLHVRGEHEARVEPFPLPVAGAPDDVLYANDAVCLFAERAQAVAPWFALNATNAVTVAAICRQLDGLPLAIELAAARTKLFTPGALLEQMTDRLRFLRGGARDLPARQRTMHDTIAWSYALLQPDQQALFRRLAVFSGGWHLGAAAAVAGADALVDHDLLDAIGLLVDQSLIRRVERVGEPRFAMLETIREFGLAALADAGEAAEARGRHAAWYREMIESLDLHHTMQGDVRRMQSLVMEQDNLRQALSWFASREDALSLNRLSAALAIFWFDLGQFTEARTWLHRAIAHDDGVPVLIRARAWCEAGWLAMCQGDLEQATPLREQGLAFAREAGEPYLLAEAIFSNGILAFWKGDLDQAAALIAEAHRAFQAIGLEIAAAPVKAGAALNLLGGVALVAGDVPLAIRYGEQAVGAARALSAAADLGYALCGLGYARFQAGQEPEAAACFLEATALTWAIHDDAFLARLFWAMAAMATSTRPEVAACLIGAADALDARTGSAMWPNDQVLAEWCLTRINEMLEPAALDALRQAGTSLAAEQAVAACQMLASIVLGDERAAEIWRAAGAPAPTISWEEVAIPRAGGLPGGDIVPDGKDIARAARIDARPAGAPRSQLTSREMDVLNLLFSGLSDREIAARLFITRRTASKHVEAILAKLGVHSRGAAVAEARRLGFLGADRT